MLDKTEAEWKGKRKREKERSRLHHVNGESTNQDTRLCCRVWSESQAVGMPGPHSRSHSSGSVSWSPAHRSQSTDSMTTTPPTAHALQTPTDRRTKTTCGWGMRSAQDERSIATQAEASENDRNMRSMSLSIFHQKKNIQEVNDFIDKNHSPYGKCTENENGTYMLLYGRKWRLQEWTFRHLDSCKYAVWVMTRKWM